MSKILIRGAKVARRRAAGRPDRRRRSSRQVGTRPDPPRAPRSSRPTGRCCCPGLVDLHTHLREPGREDSETVLTGTRAAASGGYTAVLAMANTFPVADTAGVVEQVWRLGQEHGYCDVQPVGAVTVGLEGKQLAELGAMHESARRCHRLLRRRQVRRRRRDHAPRAGVREGLRRRRRPARAGAPAHRGRPDERGRRLRRARARRAGPRSPRSRSSPATSCSPSTSAPACTSATCPPPAPSRSSAGPSPAASTSPPRSPRTTCSSPTSWCGRYNPVYKVNPPLRTERDVLALREALADGTIDIVATDHAPHPHEDKDCEWAAAAMGMVGLETALSVVQRDDGRDRACSTGPGSPTACPSARRGSAGSPGTAAPSRPVSPPTSRSSTRHTVGPWTPRASPRAAATPRTRGVSCRAASRTPSCGAGHGRRREARVTPDPLTGSRAAAEVGRR